MSARTPCVVLIIGAGFLCGGCAPRALPMAGRPERGLIWVFPGVEGGAWSMSGACNAFRDAGVKAQIRIHEWGRRFGIVTNLIEYEDNRAAAAQIAEEIARFRRRNPVATIDLVGYSGGGGLAVMVAEALPPGVRLRNVVLAQPALSPDYDLTRALRRVDGTLVNFYSPHDWVMLGAGTALLGTMDRKHVMSAGKKGFDWPLNVTEPELVRHFEQRSWTPEAALTGHVGVHFGILLYEWNRRYVAPYLLPRPDEGAAPRTRRRAPSGNASGHGSGGIPLCPHAPR